MTGIDLLTFIALTLVVGFGLSLLIFQGLTGVPAQSSNSVEAADVVALLRQAGVSETGVIYELGSGWGSLAIALAQAFPRAEIRGIEISPLPYWISRIRTLRIPNLVLRRANFHNWDLADAAAVTCYLMTKPMPALAVHLDRMLEPGTPVVSLSFWFRDRDITAYRATSGQLGAAALYLWPAYRPDHMRS